jgi:hypothetical protein
MTSREKRQVASGAAKKALSLSEWKTIVTEITRLKLTTEVVEIPEGEHVCSVCRGRGMMSKYDEGWRSLVHSDELAALRTCWACAGLGHTIDLDTLGL